MPNYRCCGGVLLVFLDENTLYGARDPQGIRPLCLGRLERGWVIASETAALDIVGASFVREIEPGEFVAIDEHGVRSTMFAKPEPKNCLFEYVYLARPDSSSTATASTVCVAVGRKLAIEAPVEADIVIPVPEREPPRPSGSPRSRASRSRRVWSRTRTSAGPSSSPLRQSGSSACA